MCFVSRRSDGRWSFVFLSLFKNYLNIFAFNGPLMAIMAIIGIRFPHSIVKTKISPPLMDREVKTSIFNTIINNPDDVILV